MTEPAKELLELARSAVAECDSAQAAINRRESQIREEFYKRMKDDPVILSEKESLKENENHLREIAQNAFIPGTIVRANTYYVVDSVRGKSVEAYEVYTRSKYTQVISIGSIVEILIPQEITDKKLRRALEKLIVRVRTKGWNE